MVERKNRLSGAVGQHSFQYRRAKRAKLPQPEQGSKVPYYPSARAEDRFLVPHRQGRRYRLAESVGRNRSKQERFRLARVEDLIRQRQGCFHQVMGEDLNLRLVRCYHLAKEAMLLDQRQPGQPPEAEVPFSLKP